MEWKSGKYFITDDKNAIDMQAVVRFICEESYWAKDIPSETQRKAMENSLCFSLYYENKQIGFARIISDYSIFGYLEDVYIDSSYRGNGLGKWLLECLLSHPAVKCLKKIMLSTTDAQSFYKKFGFKDLKKPEYVMEHYNMEEFSEFSCL